MEEEAEAHGGHVHKPVHKGVPQLGQHEHSKTAAGQNPAAAFDALARQRYAAAGVTMAPGASVINTSHVRPKTSPSLVRRKTNTSPVPPHATVVATKAAPDMVSMGSNRAGLTSSKGRAGVVRRTCPAVGPHRGAAQKSGKLSQSCWLLGYRQPLVVLCTGTLTLQQPLDRPYAARLYKCKEGCTSSVRLPGNCLAQCIAIGYQQ